MSGVFSAFAQPSRGTGSMQAANEFLSQVVQAADRNEWRFFFSDQMAQVLGQPLVYVQKLLSRLLHRRLLDRVEVPRPVMGGRYRRGTCNYYLVTPRGRDRVNWWRQRNSVPGFHYLANGVGEVAEISNSAEVNAVLSSWPSLHSFLKLRSKHEDAIPQLLTCLDESNLVTCGLSRTDAVPLSLQALMINGMIPRAVLNDPAVFAATAKNGFGCSDSQIMIAILYRSAKWYRERCRLIETHQRQNHKKVAVTNEEQHEREAMLERELAMERENRLRLECDNAGLRMKLKAEQDSRRQLSYDNIKALRLINDLQSEFHGPFLAPMKVSLNTALLALATCNFLAWSDTMTA